MLRYALPLLALPLALAAPGFTASAAEIQIQATGPVVELSVAETVEGEPDIAMVSAGVTSEAKTAVAAMRDNATRMTTVVAQLKALGIAERDIQTTGINLNPMWDYNQATQRQVFRGYQASNRVSVKLREVERTGPVLDALVASGATDIGGPVFELDDDTAARAEARRTALERARGQAEDYARMAGYEGIRLLEISESISGNQPMPMLRAVAVEQAAAANTPVQPGLVGTTVIVTVKYEMTR